MRPRFLALFLAAPLVAGCLTTRPAPPDALEWGSSFGMCVGYCAARLVVAGGTATLTETATRSGELPPRVQARALTPAEAASLAEARAASRVATDTLGCPDCADGGAEYVETGGQRVTFEFGGDAGGATPLAEALRAVRETFPRAPANL